jgi:hypothetical protein
LELTEEKRQAELEVDNMLEGLLALKTGLLVAAEKEMK